MDKIIGKIRENKLLKYGLLAALILIIVIIIVALAVGSGSNKAQKFVKTYYSEKMVDSKNVKIETKTVNRNKGKKLYIVETKISAETQDGVPIRSNSFLIIELRKEVNSIVGQFHYEDDEDRDEALEEATQAMIEMVKSEQ